MKAYSAESLLRFANSGDPLSAEEQVYAAMRQACRRATARYALGGVALMGTAGLMGLAVHEVCVPGSPALWSMMAVVPPFLCGVGLLPYSVLWGLKNHPDVHFSKNKPRTLNADADPIDSPIYDDAKAILNNENPPLFPLASRVMRGAWRILELVS